MTQYFSIPLLSPWHSDIEIFPQGITQLRPYLPLVMTKSLHLLLLATWILAFNIFFQGIPPLWPCILLGIMTQFSQQSLHLLSLSQSPQSFTGFLIQKWTLSLWDYHYFERDTTKFNRNGKMKNQVRSNTLDSKKYPMPQTAYCTILVTK